MAPRTQSGDSQAVETATPKTGKSRERVKARHLSPLLRQVILDRFAATMSSEDVAEELRIPARTVTDVVVAAMVRRGPARETNAAFAVRRSA